MPKCLRVAEGTWTNSPNTGERIPIDSSLDAFLHRVAQASKDRRTVVLASGDPLFFGIGRRLVRAVGEDRVLVLPNITSVQAFFSRLAEPWEDVRVFSLHGRSGSHAGMSWLDELTCCDRMVLFTDPGHTPEWIARELIREGFRDRFLVVAEDLGLPGEKVRRFSLEEALDGRFSPLNLVGVFREPGSPGVQEPLPRLPVFGLPEEVFPTRPDSSPSSKSGRWSWLSSASKGARALGPGFGERVCLHRGLSHRFFGENLRRGKEQGALS